MSSRLNWSDAFAPFAVRLFDFLGFPFAFSLSLDRDCFSLFPLFPSVFLSVVLFFSFPFTVLFFGASFFLTSFVLRLFSFLEVDSSSDSLLFPLLLFLLSGHFFLVELVAAASSRFLLFLIFSFSFCFSASCFSFSFNFRFFSASLAFVAILARASSFFLLKAELSVFLPLDFLSPTSSS